MPNYPKIIPVSPSYLEHYRIQAKHLKVGDILFRFSGSVRSFKLDFTFVKYVLYI